MKNLLFSFMLLFVFVDGVRAQKQVYFPHSFEADSSLGAFSVRWYSDQLLAMKEPVLFTDGSQTEIYRFTWLRTFHHPVAIRIEKHGDSYHLYWKLCSGAGGYEPGKLIVDKQKTISKAIWDRFQDQVMKINFWVMKTKEKELGNDGSQWVLEGKINSKYHLVDRWTPHSSTNYYQCCDFLIGLTDLKIASREKY